MKKIIVFLLVLFTSSLIFAQEAEDALDTNVDISASVQLAMADPDFKVTAGDVYTVAYAAGSKAVQYSILVDSTYKIRVANLAVIDASGKTFLELKKQVEDIVSKNYPMSGVQFVLTVPSVYNVVVKGEVKQTQERRAWALTRLSQVISGNTTGLSSLRDIIVTSANGKIKTYDLFKATRYGDLSQNPYVRPGDVITLKKAERIVSVSGNVNRNGSYQLQKDENLKELLNYYGDGLELSADLSRVSITRYANTELPEGQKIYLDLNNDMDFKLLDRDSVYIPSYRTLKPVMFVEGAIASAEGTNLDASDKRRIQFETGTKYTYLIRSFSSFFTAVSDIDNCYIRRGEQVIPINVRNILYNSDEELDLLVEPYDTLCIPFKQYFVSVAGSVIAPGRYPYIPDRTWDYYIGLAGGFIKTQNNKDTVTIVDIDGKILTKNDIITPETTITAETNSGLYYFNLYAPVVTTILSVVTTAISVLAVTGVFK